ncbi:hypothetical protein FA95DRAFT_1603625 [Auriscalpium vulgare]|uniref:Uncharacterized protein n=1 Tax=Auriscalpium vulgare TaxID=40419 RepID=A0ACB8S311_9AGAM|nr:hypothetical protein FA95DRAFT_1603625 [Auriscalpium vulgare]
MGKKRKTVPTRLHEELSEYSSLLRALRTTNTLDVVSHLTQPPRHFAVDAEDRSERADTPTPSRDSSPPTSSHARSKSHLSPQSTVESKLKDTWTRWPLPAADVPVPEWSFEDEVHSIIKQSITAQDGLPSQLTASSASSREFPEDDQADMSLPPSSLRVLADVSSHHLECLLGALASYIPVQKKSVQLRLKPLDWRDVIAIVSATGLVEISILRDVQERLKSIYCPTPSASSSVERADARKTANKKLAARMAHIDQDLLDSYGSSRPHKYKRGKYKPRRSVNKVPMDARKSIPP